MGLPRNTTESQTKNVSMHQYIGDKEDEGLGCYELVQKYTKFRKDAKLWIEGLSLIHI